MDSLERTTRQSAVPKIRHSQSGLEDVSPKIRIGNDEVIAGRTCGGSDRETPNCHPAAVGEEFVLKTGGLECGGVVELERVDAAETVPVGPDVRRFIDEFRSPAVHEREFGTRLPHV